MIDFVACVDNLGEKRTVLTFVNIKRGIETALETPYTRFRNSWRIA